MVIRLLSLLLFFYIFLINSPVFAKSNNILIETEELASILGNPDIVIVDARGEDIYEEGHIPGAVNLSQGNIQELKDKDYMKQTGLGLRPEKAEELFGGFGIGNSARVIVYDNPSATEASFVWAVIRIYGLDNVQILSGGIKKWKKEKRPVTKDVPTVKPAVFKANPKTELVVTAEWIVKNDGKAVLLDARGGEDYIGATGGGHIPGALSMEWIKVADARNSFKSPDEIRDLLSKSGITQDKEIVAYCQVGPKASVLFAALKMMGYKVSLYWGSMAEWSKDPSLKVER